MTFFSANFFSSSGLNIGIPYRILAIFPEPQTGQLRGFLSKNNLTCGPIIGGQVSVLLPFCQERFKLELWLKEREPKLPLS